MGGEIIVLQGTDEKVMVDVEDERNDSATLPYGDELELFLEEDDSLLMSDIEEETRPPTELEELSELPELPALTDYESEGEPAMTEYTPIDSEDEGSRDSETLRYIAEMVDEFDYGAIGPASPDSNYTANFDGQAARRNNESRRREVINNIEVNPMGEFVNDEEEEESETDLQIIDEYHLEPEYRNTVVINNEECEEETRHLPRQGRSLHQTQRDTLSNWDKGMMIISFPTNVRPIRNQWMRTHDHEIFPVEELKYENTDVRVRNVMIWRNRTVWAVSAHIPRTLVEWIHSKFNVVRDVRPLDGDNHHCGYEGCQAAYTSRHDAYAARLCIHAIAICFYGMPVQYLIRELTDGLDIKMDELCDMLEAHTKICYYRVRYL